MITLNELEKWFHNQQRIIFDINVAMDNIKRMTFANPEEDEILKHGFFDHFYRQSRFIIIVQLCKLFSISDNQKISFSKLFNRLINDKYDSEIKGILTTNTREERLFKNRDDIKKEINILIKEIEQQRSLIEKVITLRDKFYAHSDPDSNLPKVSNTELEVLVKLSVKIYNTIRSRILDVTFMFEFNSEWKIDYPIRVLTENRRTQHEYKKNLIASAQHCSKAKPNF